MRTLFLDIATHASSSFDGSGGAIACVEDGRVASLIPVDDRMDDSVLMPAVERALKEASWSYADLTHLAAVVGPGGFTSLRMGVSLANILADQLNIPAAGIHLSDLYAARASFELWAMSFEKKMNIPSVLTAHSLPLTALLWMHSTKKAELFVRGFGSLAEKWKEAALISIEDLVADVGAWHAKPLQVCGECIPLHCEMLGDSIKPAQLRPLAEILPMFLAELSYEKKLLLPWYGRGW